MYLEASQTESKTVLVSLYLGNNQKDARELAAVNRGNRRKKDCW